MCFDRHVISQMNICLSFMFKDLIFVYNLCEPISTRIFCLIDQSSQSKDFLTEFEFILGLIFSLVHDLSFPYLHFMKLVNM